MGARECVCLASNMSQPLVPTMNTSLPGTQSSDTILGGSSPSCSWDGSTTGITRIRADSPPAEHTYVTVHCEMTASLKRLLLWKAVRPRVGTFVNAPHHYQPICTATQQDRAVVSEPKNTDTAVVPRTVNTSLLGACSTHSLQVTATWYLWILDDRISDGTVTHLSGELPLFPLVPRCCPLASSRYRFRRRGCQ